MRNFPQAALILRILLAAIPSMRIRFHLSTLIQPDHDALTERL